MLSISHFWLNYDSIVSPGCAPLAEFRAASLSANKACLQPKMEKASRVVLRVDEIHFAPPVKPWNDTILLQIPTDSGFNHGFNHVVRNGFHPQFASDCLPSAQVLFGCGCLALASPPFFWARLLRAIPCWRCSCRRQRQITTLGVGKNQKEKNKTTWIAKLRSLFSVTVAGVWGKVHGKKNSSNWRSRHGLLFLPRVAPCLV